MLNYKFKIKYIICILGGHDGQSYLNSVERYDPIKNSWDIDVAPTSSCRTSVGVAVLGILFIYCRHGNLEK